MRNRVWHYSVVQIAQAANVSAWKIRRDIRLKILNPDVFESVSSYVTAMSRLNKERKNGKQSGDIAEGG
jgi:hypothetical protein